MEKPTGPEQADSKDNLAPRVVVSQPMFFPWYGLLEQIKLCDSFVFYDDVQYSKGSFSNRVQVKTPQGVRWLTVPLRDVHLGQNINKVSINNQKNWQKSLTNTLQQAYAKSPYKHEMLSLVESVFCRQYDSLCELSMASMTALLDYFDLAKHVEFYISSHMNVQGSSTQRVLDICQQLKAISYLTGHGAKHYLQHELFETAGIEVHYMDYGLHPYIQQNGEFTPYVSALDLIANCGKNGISHISGGEIPWRQFIHT